MEQRVNISEFMFNAAQYFVGSDSGESAVLQINYKENTFIVKREEAVLSSVFEQELVRIATSLLARKHGVNFAHRVNATTTS